MKIAISGIPSTGKSTVAKILARRTGLRLVEISKLAEEEGCFSGYDEKRESKILDMEKLKKVVAEMDDIILDGHVSHEFSVDFVIVLRCNPKVLEEKLKERYPRNPFKVKENLEAELIGLLTSEALALNARVYEIDTTNTDPEKVVDIVLSIIRDGKGYEAGGIDWIERGYSPV